MSAYDLVEEVKKNTGIESDNQIAVAIGKERANVSNWRMNRSKPDGESILKLCVLGNIDPKRALQIMQGGYTSLTFIAVTGMISGALMLASNGYINDLLYIMRN